MGLRQADEIITWGRPLVRGGPVGASLFRKVAGREAFRGQRRLLRIYLIEGPKNRKKYRKENC